MQLPDPKLASKASEILLDVFQHLQLTEDIAKIVIAQLKINPDVVNLDLLGGV